MERCPPSMHLARCPNGLQNGLGGFMPIQGWAQWCPGRNRALAAKQQGGLLPLTLAMPKIRGKLTLVGEGEVETGETWEEE